MIYTLVVVFVAVLLLALTILQGKYKNQPKVFLYINLSLFIIGVALMAVSYIIGIDGINSIDNEPDLHSWAKDFLDLYYDISFVPFALLLIINLIASILGIYVTKYQTPISKILRYTVSIFSSILLLLIPFYGYFTLNDSIPLLLYMALSGIGQALTMRIANVVELTNQIRRNRGKNNDRSRK
ncbi:MAG: hypothetical protein E7627_00035 [Ruminococcaceae bacterium]|nr:hypothetical protein [Oscillospiraceae bacterium]